MDIRKPSGQRGDRPVPDTRDGVVSGLTVLDGVPPACAGTAFGMALERALAELRSPVAQVAGFDNRI
jgi:hypothetical protein